MRLRHVVSALAGALALAGTLADDALAQRRGEEWVELGCKEVSFRVDRDVLPVGRQEGRFYAIRLYARGGAVEMLNLRVIYANGDPDNIPVRVFRPVAEGRYPGLLLFSEIFQLTGPVRRMAAMLAGHGFVVAAPAAVPARRSVAVGDRHRRRRLRRPRCRRQVRACPSC